MCPQRGRQGRETDPGLKVPHPGVLPEVPAVQRLAVPSCGVKETNSQFLMSEMNTASPRIPSPLDTAGILSAAGGLQPTRTTRCSNSELCLWNREPPLRAPGAPTYDREPDGPRPLQRGNALFQPPKAGRVPNLFALTTPLSELTRPRTSGA